MGHLLSTVNPEAAEAIKPEGQVFPVRPPYIGEPVQYFARPGEGRGGGREIFPAMIMKFAEDGVAELCVIYGADDFRDRINIPKRTHDKPWNSWDFMPNATEGTGGIKMLWQAIFGKHDPVEESVYGMILRLGARVKHIEEDLATRAANRGRKRLIPREGEDPEAIASGENEDD